MVRVSAFPLMSGIKLRQRNSIFCAVKLYICTGSSSRDFFRSDLAPLTAVGGQDAIETGREVGTETLFRYKRRSDTRRRYVRTGAYPAAHVPSASDPARPDTPALKWRRQRRRRTGKSGLLWVTWVIRRTLKASSWQPTNQVSYFCYIQLYGNLKLPMKY